MTDNSLLYRQIHPSQLQNGGVSTLAFNVISSAFNPTENHHYKLSVYDGEEYSPKEAFNHFTSGNNRSCGVLGVSVDEFTAESLKPVRDDDGFHGHVSVDYSEFSKGERSKKAKILRDKALTRNWCFKPEEQEDLPPF